VLILKQGCRPPLAKLALHFDYMPEKQILMNDSPASNINDATRYRVTGMDCPSCAAKIEKAVRSVGVDDVRVSIASQIMTLRPDDPKTHLTEVERAVTAIGYQLDILDGRNSNLDSESVATADCPFRGHPASDSDLIRPPVPI